jgi:hypothetical protein
LSRLQAPSRDGRPAALSRHPEHLDDADPEPHRHALDRSPHPDRDQDPRLGPEGHPGIGEQLEGIFRDIPGTRSVLAERTAGGYYVDFVLNRDELARYGLSVEDAQAIVTSAIGGDTVTTTVEGRERYPVNVRYGREFRQNVHRLRRVLVPTPSGAQVPMAQLADIRLLEGASMIRDENGQLAGYVYVDMAGRDVGGVRRGGEATGAGTARSACWLHSLVERAVRETSRGSVSGSRRSCPSRSF